jgi:hypothetical protein
MLVVLVKETLFLHFIFMVKEEFNCLEAAGEVSSTNTAEKRFPDTESKEQSTSSSTTDEAVTSLLH